MATRISNLTEELVDNAEEAAKQAREAINDARDRLSGIDSFDDATETAKENPGLVLPLIGLVLILMAGIVALWRRLV